ncbi:hypothetical protein Q7P37_006387 [Cladosporium fusiforme]
MAEVNFSTTKDSKTQFVALGGIWLDEITSPGKETLFDVPGGSVTFATFGALAMSSETPKAIGLVVKAGYDFPSSLERVFTEWDVDLHILRLPDHPSPRGRVLYGQNASERTYQRLTQPLPSTPQDLATSSMISASCFHFFDVAAEVSQQVNQIESLRREQGIDSRPVYVWEPQAKSCSPETFEHHRAVINKVDIFSPNHAELASFFSPSSSGTVVFSKEIVERQARDFLSLPLARPLCILIRCAEHGCFVLSASSEETQETWLPAFHPPGSNEVVDPTGAGNAFLGGAAMGFLEHGDPVKAAAYGSVAASFVVEVVGLPEIGRCNGTARLGDYMHRLGGSFGSMVSAPTFH